jgi:tryptophan synthase beta chain
MYKYYRSTPLVRAYGLEKALDTPAHIYFKNESVSPVGSHKLNSALAQAYFCKQEGVTNVTTETGAGQWGAAMSYAAKAFGLELAVYMVKISYEQKPYRRSIMQTFGAQVTASPSMSTRAGKDILTADPTCSGSLGCAISEAIELAQMTPHCKYVLGSVLSHVTLHQTVIGLEAEKQMAMAGEYPDMIIACFGGGSNFGGVSFPFMRHKIQGSHPDTVFIAAEPASCPKLTKGKFEYDYGDESGYTPLLPMYTLGHNFQPANIHAGGLRYHGAGTIVSQLLKDHLMQAVDIPQLETFKAATLFAQTEGIIPAPESSHAIAATIREALKCKEEGKGKTILFNLSGHGLIDMTAYDMYMSGDLQNYSVSDETIAKYLKEVEPLNK